VPDLVLFCQHIWYRFRTIFGAGLGLGGRNLWTSQDFGPWLVPDNTEHQLQENELKIFGLHFGLHQRFFCRPVVN
jgi:hypothetical protein